MPEPSPAAPAEPTDGDRFVYMSDVCRDVGVTDRCVRKWIVRGIFPQPDANLRGRNCWRLSTFRAWKADALAGKYRAERNPSGLRPGSRAA
jgi:predicted DNA-binding transcriptional regulator AlpA